MKDTASVVEHDADAAQLGYIVELILQHSKNYMPDLTCNENRIKLFEEIYSNPEKGYSGDNLHYIDMMKEMASNLEVDDPCYFFRMFSELMGVSPVGYRKTNKSDNLLLENVNISRLSPFVYKDDV